MTAPGPGRDELARQLLRRHWHHALLAGWLVVCVLVYARHGGQSWHFFATGARSLICRQRVAQACGLHVYAQHPDLQIGPLTLLLAVPAVLLRRTDGFDLARGGMAVVGYLIVLLLERAAEPENPLETTRLQRRTLLAGLAFLPAWTDLAVGFGHLDDVLALLFTAAAVRVVRMDSPRAAPVTGWLLAAATISKPWAVAFLPLAFALPRGRRRPALLPAVLVPPLTALPFLLADPGTLRAAAFRIPNAAASSLRLLGVSDATPPWDRPLQFGLGAALALLAVRWGRWPAVVMIAAAVRIMWDPQVYSYYTAGVLLGTLIWDLFERRGRVVPIWTWAVFGALFVCRYLSLPAQTLGALRLVICLVIVICALFLPGVLARVVPPRQTAGSHAAGAS